jgi:hypothetical protein
MKNTIGAGLVIGGFSVFVLVLGWQGFHFLRSGEWFPVSIFDVLTFISPDLANGLYPDNWHGLSMILTWLHGGFLMMVCAVLLGSAFLDP